jgi:small-conductance mechanosensitive channel
MLFELKRKLKGLQQLTNAVVSLTVLGLIIVVMAYMTGSFKTALNSNDTTITNVFDKITGFYSTVANFLSPLGTIIIFSVILAIIIGVMAYFGRGGAGTP